MDVVFNLLAIPLGFVMWFALMAVLAASYMFLRWLYEVFRARVSKRKSEE